MDFKEVKPAKGTPADGLGAAAPREDVLFGTSCLTLRCCSGHCAMQSLLRASPGRTSLYARATHASHPFGCSTTRRRSQGGGGRCGGVAAFEHRLRHGRRNGSENASFEIRKATRSHTFGSPVPGEGYGYPNSPARRRIRVGTIGRSATRPDDR
jgi:hypothetical protein